MLEPLRSGKMGGVKRAIEVLDSPNGGSEIHECRSWEVQSFCNIAPRVVPPKQVKPSCDMISRREYDEIRRADMNFIVSYLDSMCEWYIKRQAGTSHVELGGRTVPVNNRLEPKFVSSKNCGFEQSDNCNVVQNNVKFEKCVFCEQSHKLFNCVEFLKLSINDRWTVVMKHNLCFKCVDFKYPVIHNCGKICEVNNCAGPHHGCLHDDNFNTKVNENNVIPSPCSEEFRIHKETDQRCEIEPSVMAETMYENEIHIVDIFPSINDDIEMIQKLECDGIELPKKTDIECVQETKKFSCHLKEKPENDFPMRVKCNENKSRDAATKKSNNLFITHPRKLCFSYFPVNKNNSGTLCDLFETFMQHQNLSVNNDVFNGLISTFMNDLKQHEYPDLVAANMKKMFFSVMSSHRNHQLFMLEDNKEEDAIETTVTFIYGEQQTSSNRAEILPCDITICDTHLKQRKGVECFNRLNHLIEVPTSNGSEKMIPEHKQRASTHDAVDVVTYEQRVCDEIRDTSNEYHSSTDDPDLLTSVLELGYVLWFLTYATVNLDHTNAATETRDGIKSQRSSLPIRSSTYLLQLHFEVTLMYDVVPENGSIQRSFNLLQRRVKMTHILAVKRSSTKNVYKHNMITRNGLPLRRLPNYAGLRRQPVCVKRLVNRYRTDGYNGEYTRPPVKIIRRGMLSADRW
jgi:hypothetical protein